MTTPAPVCAHALTVSGVCRDCGQVPPAKTWRDGDLRIAPDIVKRDAPPAPVCDECGHATTDHTGYGCAMACPCMVAIVQPGEVPTSPAPERMSDQEFERLARVWTNFRNPNSAEWQMVTEAHRARESEESWRDGIMKVLDELPPMAGEPVAPYIRVRRLCAALAAKDAEIDRLAAALERIAHQDFDCGLGKGICDTCNGPTIAREALEGNG